MRRVAAAMRHEPVVGVNKLMVDQLSAPIEWCAFLIGNDTGPMHIWPAVGTPTSGLIGPELPLRYRPYGPRHKAIHQPLDCSPCINVHLGPGSGCVNPVRHLCMKLITVESVWKEVQSQLDTALAVRPPARKDEDRQGGVLHHKEKGL